MLLIFLHSEDKQIFIFLTSHNNVASVVTFWKYAFLHHFLVYFPNYIARVYAKNILLLLVRYCYDIISDIIIHVWRQHITS